MESHENTLSIAEVFFETGQLCYRYARYLSTDEAKWIRHGLFQSFHSNGQIASEGTCEHGVEHGLWRDYHKTGQLAAEGRYDKGIETGVWRFWRQDGVEEPSEYHNPHKPG